MSAASHCHAYIFPPRAIEYNKICEANGQLFRCFLLASWQIRRLSYQAPVLRDVFSLMRVSRRIYTYGIPEEPSDLTLSLAISGLSC